MVAFLLRRLAVACATVLLAVVLVFFAVRLLPGNPILARFGQHAVPEQVAAEMERQGWNEPLVIQLATYLWGIVSRGDLGVSLLYPTTDVREELQAKFPATLELAFAAMLLAVPLGVLSGTAAAVWRGRFPDFICTAGALVGVSVPVFFLGICLMSVSDHFFGGYFPIGGRLPIGSRFESVTGLVTLESLYRGRLDITWQALKHLCLPAIALSSIPAAIIARITRSSMLDVLTTDYARTARAKGSSPRRVVFRHALPNAAVPIVNIAGLQASLLLTGAVLTETVFTWPGLGSYLVHAVQTNDYGVVQGAMLLVATIFAAANLVLDIVYAWLDPRIRIAAGR